MATLYRKIYTSLYNLAWTTVYNKWPNYWENVDNDNEHLNNVPEEIEHLLEDFPQYFKFDDRQHLLYKWIASPRLLQLIQEMEDKDEEEEYEIAGMEELHEALENGEIGCIYKY